MEMSSLPTDSLYKFCALVGTVIVILALYVPRKMAWDLDDQLVEIDKQVKIAEIETAFVTERLAQLEKLIATTIAYQKGEYHPDSDKFVFTYSNDEAKVFMAETHELQKESEIRVAEVRCLHELNKRVLNRTVFIQRMGFVLIVPGLILAAFGYIAWYFRIQRYQDLAVRELTKDRDI